MIQLHVWGKDKEISIISPECVAVVWILNLVLSPQKVPFEVVTSNNTNLSDVNQLPVLIDGDRKYSGFTEIVKYIDEKYNKTSSEILSTKNMSNTEKLFNQCLINLLDTKIKYINQYNLYLNTQNYERYTRKLFSSYLPFPMMYNQPLKYYKQAQEQVKLLGLGKSSGGFFNLMTNEQQEEEVAQTEIFNDEISDDEDEDGKVAAISSLHEKQLLKKSKTKQVLQESKNSMRCLILINNYINEIVKLYKERNPDSGKEFGFIFGDNSVPSSSEVLFYAYIYCLTNDVLPDRFIYNYLHQKRGTIVEFIDNVTNDFNDTIDEESIRDPIDDEIPNLINEVKIWANWAISNAAQ